MREILFRGKRVDNNQWIEGPYIQSYASGYIYLAEKHPKMVLVVRETVGQYTGLKDKNGARIFEGDIVLTSEYGVEARGKNFSGKDVFCVRFHHAEFVIENHSRRFSLMRNEKMEVIGNIFDNPELLKGYKT